MYEEILNKAKKQCVEHIGACETCKYNQLCLRTKITPFGADTYIRFLMSIQKEQ